MQTSQRLESAKGFIIQLPQFIVYIFHRARQNRLRVAAGYLAYVTLLSIVPLVSVIFSMLSAFPVFDKIKLQIEEYVYGNFMPASGDVIQQNLTEFVDNASKAGAVGIVALILFALMLISNIDKVLNEIWRSPKKRPLVISFSIYWMVLTLGPLLLGASVAISSYVLSLGGLQSGVFNELVEFFLRWLPLLFSVLAFLMVYLLVPNVRVRFFDALCGAVSAAILFELSKKCFALYISYVPSYQAIYGALAAIPILFIWVYLSWIVVLIGAELTAGLPEFYSKKIIDNQSEKEGEHADSIPSN
ncbi:MAG: virulence factor BrkB family protein [Gammaproteobacteria bacterium]|nr:virulence factor BrkB family protein [Gammaproteobacteria bacterium]